MSQVVSIHRVKKRMGPTELLSDATFSPNFGLEEDWRSRAGRSRQITLIEEEALEEVAHLLGLPAVPPGSSRRQVLVRGIRLNPLVGLQLRVGPLLVAVHGLCDPCNNMERMIGPGAQKAMEGRGGICGRILEGGVLRPGDAITVVSAQD